MRDPLAGADAEACDECPAALLAAYMDTVAGHRIKSANDLLFALELGVSISQSEIQYPEFVLLRILTEERNRFHSEDQRAMHRGR